MEYLPLPIELLVFLFAISIVAGLIDTLAGGGGLIVLPALIMSGVPPLQALGTNKLQGTMGTATATLLMFKKGKLRWVQVKQMMFSAFIGAVIGTLCLQFINAQLLSFIIPMVLLFIGAYFLVAPVASQESVEPKMSATKYRRFIVPLIGFYDGMFGPGTGSFYALAGVSLRGHGLITATAEAKPLNFSTNIASLMVFVIAGQLVWIIGILMMVGQVIGAWLGARCLFIVKPKFIRALVVTICFSMLIKYAHSMSWLTF